MDPTANLKKQIELAKRIIKEAEEFAPDEDVEELALELAEHVLALDEWIRRGGFLPTRWNREVEPGTKAGD